MSARSGAAHRERPAERLLRGAFASNLLVSRVARVVRDCAPMGQRRTAARRRSIEARPPATAPTASDPIDVLVARARRLWTRGDLRRALSVLREACNADEWRARTWTIFAARLALAGQREEAAQAFTRARWLRKREGDGARLAILERLARAAV